MKASPVKLYDLLRALSVDGVLDPLALNLSPEGVKVGQVSTDRDIHVAGIVSPDFFQDYNPYGPVRLRWDTVKALYKAFKVDSEVNISFTDSEVMIQGQRESYADKLGDIDVPTVEWQEGKVGILVLPKVEPTITHVLTTQSSELDLPFKEVDSVLLKYKPGELQISVSDGIMRYSKRIPASHVSGEGETSVAISKLHFETITKLLGGAVTLAFTKGPLIFNVKKIDYRISYTVAQYLG